MRTRLFTVSALLFLACGGNWSNSDLVFSSALPRSADLKSVLPAGSTAQPLEGVSTRRDGLMVGDASNAWAQTRKAVRDYNGILDGLLGLIDQVRQLPPTRRTADSRTWGPYADSKNPGREVQVVITRIDEANFEWRVESRPFNGEFLRVIVGVFKATDSARRGQGTITVPIKDFREVVKVDENMKQIDQIDIGYMTDLFPKRVEMLFTLKPGSTLGLSALGYTSREQEDGSGAMRFLYTLPGLEVQELEISSAWLPTGEGKGVGVVRKGLYSGATITECWGRSHTVVHYSESWTGGVISGPATACVSIEGL